MSSLRNSAVRIAWQRRPTTAERVSDERPSAKETGLVERGLLTDTQVWNWTESVTLSGNGPGASSFL
ncbi:hypothetical protein [Streptomyces sp. NPDC059894]|uniref:hypothetical protein n=1 Tax=unclassified Streptomyces TaxID=2593676 RepID=UPI0036569B22